MKKALFFLMLLPCLAFSQNAAELLVRWEGTRVGGGNPTTVPMYYNTASPSVTAPNNNMTAANMSGNNINFFSTNNYNGFYGSTWPVANTPDYSKYYQMAITAGGGKKIEAKHLKFVVNGYASSYKIVYQIASSQPTAESFSTNGTVLATLTGVPQTTDATYTLPFASGVNINSGSTMYIRIYAYQLNQWNVNLLLKFNSPTNFANPNSNGPAFYGVIGDAAVATAYPDTDATYETEAITKNVVANDTAPGLTITSVQLVSPQPAQGTVTLDGNNITYTPLTPTTPASLGEKTIGYKITASNGTTSESTYKVTVNAYPNPTAVNKTATIMENSTATVAALEGANAGVGSISSINISGVTGQPSTGVGTAVVTGTNIVYTPGNGYSGTATITYTLTNSKGKTSSPATVTVTVTPFASPIVGNDTATTTENSAVTITVLDNDQAGSGTITSITTGQPAAGQGTTAVSGNSIVYTPATGFSGPASFTYTVTNSNNKTSSAATVNVTVNPFASPVAGNDTATTGKNVPVTIPVLNNDTAGSGTLSTIEITGQPLGAGGASVSGSSIVYTPSASFTGTATIKYKVTNSNNKLSNEAIVTVTVVNVVAVTANNASISTAKNTAITFNPLAYVVAGNSAVTQVTVAGNPSHGSVTVNLSTNEFTYTPDNNYMGSDSFTYTAKDAYNATATATVSVSVLQPSTTGALCGTYAIGTTVQYDYPQFTTLTQAINHLNTNGVTCPVTFILVDNLYTNATGEAFPIVINQFNGTSVTNTVTFKPAPFKNVTVKVEDIMVEGSNYQATTVFQLNGADNIIFDGSNAVNGSTRNLTIFNNNTIEYRNRASIWVASNGTNGAQNVTIKHTNLRQGYRNQQGLFTLGVFVGSNTILNPTSQNGRDINMTELAGGNNSNLYVWNNDFVNTKQGVYVQGNATAVTTGVNIFQNDLGAEDNQESVILPVSLNNVSNFSVSENQIYNLYRTTTAADLISGGINVKGNSTAGSITKNSLRELQRLTSDANTFAGIVLAANGTNSNILVANNYILDPRTLGNGGGYSNGFGIIVDNGGGYRIYHNTIVLSKNQPQGGYSAALYVNSNGSNLDVRNNIFVNNQTNTATRRCAILVNNDVDNLNAIFTHLDYNNYYSADRIGYIANQQGVNLTWFDNPDFVTTFGGWKSALNATNNSANANNKDTHSINIDPVFVSTGDVHLATNNGAMNDKGQFIAEVPKDIDGQLRNTSTPDVGADEFGVGSTTPTNPGQGNGIYCSASTTWENGAWSNGLPESGKDVIFRSDKTFSAEDIYACSIFVENDANVNFISQSNAYVTHNVNVAEGSSLTFESSSNLLQTENTQNIGNVTVKRSGSKLKRLDYILWSSPVTGTQTLHDFSPNTLDNRFYKYVNASNLYAMVDSYNTTFTKAKSFLIRMPNTHPTTPTAWTGVFQGTPNNGNVLYPLEYLDATHGFNAVGNPYPSPISVTAFIDANINNITGTIWVWRKTNDTTQSTYSTITRAGYTANQAPGGSTEDNELIGNPFELLPNIGALNTGQGFIVKSKGPGKELVFRNNMRVDLNYSNFFRNANDAETPVVHLWNRLWLNVKGPAADNFSQILVGYSSNATAGYDDGYDGTALSGGDVNLSSLLTEGEQETKLAINARPQFVNTDVVRLGFTTEVAGTFTFELDHVDGLFTGDQNIYIVDALTNNFHNIKQGNYTFSSEIGTFNDRFTIVYATEEELGTTVPVVDAKNVIVYRDGKQISIKAPQEIKSVTVYDMLGRTLFENSNINAEEFVTSGIDTAQQVVIVKMTFADRQVVSKKIMMN